MFMDRILPGHFEVIIDFHDAVGQLIQSRFDEDDLLLIDRFPRVPAVAERIKDLPGQETECEPHSLQPPVLELLRVGRDADILFGNEFFDLLVLSDFAPVIPFDPWI